MRTSVQLRKITEMADHLREQRGDTEWRPEDRANVNHAYELLTSACEHEPERRHTKTTDAWACRCGLSLHDQPDTVLDCCRKAGYPA